QLTALIADRGEGTDQFADPRAVNVGNIAQVQQDLLLSLAQQVANRVAEHHTAFSQSDAATHVHDGDAVYLPTVCLHCHCGSSSFAALRPRCLIRVISVPGCFFLNFTSSIKARMRKIPRPEPFIRFSGASGSGKLSGSSPLP